MKISILLKSVLLVVVGARPNKVPMVLNPQATLGMRGGVGDNLPSTAVKAVGTAYLFQGAYKALSPDGDMELYGFKEKLNPLNKRIIRQIGISVFNLGVHCFCLIVKDYSIKTSVALSSLLWLADSLESLLNTRNKTNSTEAGDLSIFAFSALNAYAALEKVEWFESSLKYSSLFAVLSAGVPFLLCPKKTVEIWKGDGLDKFTPGIASFLGCNLTCESILTGCLACGMDPIKAVGYSSLLGVVLLTKEVFFTPEVDDLDLNIKMLAVWPFACAITAALIFL